MIATGLSLHHVVRPPQVQAEKPPLLILLHGVGSNEQDLFGLAPYLDERFFVVSARAPNTLARGSFAWFHVQFVAGAPSIAPEEAESSRQMLIEFVKEATESYGTDPARVYLIGFSQGAIMSLSVMLTEPELLAGVAALSGRILPEVVPLIASAERLDAFPVLVQHGLYDQVLPISYGRASRDLLSKLPVKLTYREYPMAHQISDHSLADLRNWLSDQLDSPWSRHSEK